MTTGRPGVLGALAWANLRSHRVQSAFIALTLCASGALLTLGLGARAASGDAWARLFRATNGADLWIYANPSRANTATLNTVARSTPGVAESSPAMPDAQISLVGVRPTGFGSGFRVREWPSDPRALGHPLLVAGRALDPRRADEVVLDQNVARSFAISVGSTVRISTPGGVRALEVVGLDASAENCPFPTCSPQTFYVGAGGLARLGLSPAAPGAHGDYALALRVLTPTAAGAEAVRAALTARLPAGAVDYTTLASDSRGFAQLSFAVQAGLLLGFAVVSAIAGAMLIVVAIGGAVRADSRRIGLLKAVGLSQPQLRLVSLVEYSGLGGAAAAAGAAGACIALPHLLGSLTQQFAIGQPGPPWADGIAATVAVTAVVTAVVLVTSRRAVRMDAVHALRADAAGQMVATPLYRGPVTVSRAVSDILAAKGRALMTGLALAIAAASLVWSILMHSGFGFFMNDLAYDGAHQGDLMALGSPSLPAGRAEAVIRSQPGVAGVVREQGLTYTFPGSSETLNLRLRDGDLAALPQPLMSGRELENPGEAVVAYGLAHKHHLSVGGTLTIDLQGRLRTFHIVGINHEFNNLGQMATTLASSVADVPSSPWPVYLIAVRPGADAPALATAIQSRTGGLVNPAVINQEMLPPTIRSISPVLVILSVLLVLLTAIGVFNAVMLGVQERRREYGLLRALGMDQRRVLAVALASTVVLALAACAIAIPAAIAASTTAFAAILRGIGVGPVTRPLPSSVWAVAPLVVAIGVLGAAIPAWMASRTTVSTVLRDL